MKIQEQLDAMGADIRNKLSPFKNLIALIQAEREETDPAVKSKIQIYIDKECKNCYDNIEYLKNLL